MNNMANTLEEKLKMSPTKASAPNPVVKQPLAKTETVKEESKKAAFEPRKRTMSELVQEVTNVSNDMELWYLTYMLHAPECFELRKQTEENILKTGQNDCCRASELRSWLWNVSRCAAEIINGYSRYSDNWSPDINKLSGKCPGCVENMKFCPHKMTAYIEYVCKNNKLDVEEVYRNILGETYRKKPQFASYRKLDIPREEYDFIDAVSAKAAAQLIKLRLIDVTTMTDNRIAYSYLSVCEQTRRSHFEQMKDYYRCKSGKNDFIRKTDFVKEVTENRNCVDCMFPQCPDKVAAYLIYLASKYQVSVLELAEFVVTENKIKGVTLRGNFRYYVNLQKLEEIPFTPESRTTLTNIVRYVVNRHAMSEAKVPFIQFNLVLHTKDEQSADDVATTFNDFLHYYCYYTDKGLPIKEYKFSDKGLDGLIELIKEIEKPTLLHIKEMALLASSAESYNSNTRMQMTQLTNLIAEKEQILCVVISGEKSKLDAALSVYNDFYQGTMSYHLTISDMSSIKIVQSIVDKLKVKYELEDGFESALEYYVISKYGESPLKSKAFIQSVVREIVFNHYNKELNTENKLLVKDIPMASNRRTDEEIWAELNGLTGLETVKDEIRNIEQLLKFQKKIQTMGMKGPNRPNMHMVFAGNPGTGKTTVARIIAEILYNVGFIKQNKLVEVSSKDLIGKYIGHTAPQTAAICESAYGGVLFIDEAYELAVTSGSSGSNNFRSECIAELIKQMEDNRDKLIVIFAGYTKEMQGLIESNAGFASRIGKVIEFEDYSTEQLTDMFVRIVYKNGMRISEEAKTAVIRNIEQAKQLPNFGNGRYIRNLYENVIMEHAKNMVDVDDVDVLVEIRENDIPMV